MWDDVRCISMSRIALPKDKDLRGSSTKMPSPRSCKAWYNKGRERLWTAQSDISWYLPSNTEETVWNIHFQDESIFTMWNLPPWPRIRGRAGPYEDPSARRRCALGPLQFCVGWTCVIMSRHDVTNWLRDLWFSMFSSMGFKDGLWLWWWRWRK